MSARTMLAARLEAWPRAWMAACVGAGLCAACAPRSAAPARESVARTEHSTPTPASTPTPTPTPDRAPAPLPPPVAAGESPATGPAAASALVEVFPMVRVDRAARVVEFDGVVPIDAHDPQTPRVYLELIVCGPDTREHESLVMTRARPSHLHAALLLIGLAPGSPGAVRAGPDGGASVVAPTGAAVRVELIAETAQGRAAPVEPGAWIIGDDGRAFVPPEGAEAGWVFAGSRLVRRGAQRTAGGAGGTGGGETYDADGTGVIVGLATFGSEVISPRWVWSPESALQPPVWIARRDAVPRAGTRVIVRVTPRE